VVLLGVQAAKKINPMLLLITSFERKRFIFKTPRMVLPERLTKVELLTILKYYLT
jgi:hypothetical protein